MTSGISYSTFSPECIAWLTFQSQLASHSFTSLTIKGSTNPTGITLTNSAYVAAIANALNTNTAYGPVSSNGYSWAVGNCAVSGIGYQSELTASGGICGCSSSYTVRPCIGNSNWGGINGATCGAGTQTLTVIFQWKQK